MSTIVILAVGFGLGLLYAHGKTNPIRHFWHDARRVTKAAYEGAKDALRECRSNSKDEE